MADTNASSLPVARSRGLTLLLSFLTAVGPLSTDMYLPSLPAIVTFFDTSMSQVQLTLAVFMFGFAFGQVFYGPLSDRYGRRPVLIVGLSIYVLGSLACFAAFSIESLIAARLLQAIGAASGIVLARAIVRDLFGGEKAARLLSFMGALMAVVPLLAPLLGAVFEVQFGWRANFGFIFAASALLLILVLVRLPETLVESPEKPWSLGAMFSDFGYLLRQLVFVRYLATVVFTFSGLFVFISTSSFVLQGQFGLGELAYGFAFASAVAGYITGTLIGARMAGFVDVETSTFIGTIILALAGLAMISLTLLPSQHVWHVLVPMAVFMIGLGITMPQSMAGALTPFPRLAGTASSLLGMVQNGLAASFSVAATAWVAHNHNGLVWAIGGFGLASFLVSLVYRYWGSRTS